MQNYQDLEVHTDYLDLSKLKKIKFFNQQKQLSV